MANYQIHRAFFSFFKFTWVCFPNKPKNAHVVNLFNLFMKIKGNHSFVNNTFWFVTHVGHLWMSFRLKAEQVVMQL